MKGFEQVLQSLFRDSLATIGDSSAGLLVLSENSNRRERIPVVVTEQSSRSLATCNFSISRRREFRFNDLVVQPLVVSFPMQ